jgi:hypothetical protein
MDLRPYAEHIQQQLVAAAEPGGDETRGLAERLVAPLDAAIRLTLQDALAVAVEEITCELAPGSVELRVRGRDLEFVVTPPPSEEPGDSEGHGASASAASASAAFASVDGDEGAMARINVRMPELLKARIEQAAGAEGLSVNAWLMRAAGAALERNDPSRRAVRRTPLGGQRYTGWAR